MNLNVNACRPSFGVVSRSAIDLAKSLCQQDIDKLVASQEENEKYNVTTTVSDSKTTLRSFCVSKYTGHIIKKFPSLVAACLYASALENNNENEAI